MAHEQRHEANKLWDEENEREYGKSEECVTKNFTNNIAVEDAHDATRECSTAPCMTCGRESR